MNLVAVKWLIDVPIDTGFGGGHSGDSMTVVTFLVIIEVDMIK